MTDTIVGQVHYSVYIGKRQAITANIGANCNKSRHFATIPITFRNIPLLTFGIKMRQPDHIDPAGAFVAL